MDIEIRPRVLKGSVGAPFSKSDAHRVLIAAALCKEPTEITLSCESEDILATVNCLEALGARLVSLDSSGLHYCMEPISTRDGSSAPARDGNSMCTLNCNQSGTTLRLLMPVVAALGITARFTASGRLPERPLSELTAVLAANGACFSETDPGSSLQLPLVLEGKLRPGTFRLPGNISSQYISGLLYALPLLDDQSCIALTTQLESASYVEMTQSTLRDFCITSTKTAKTGEGSYQEHDSHQEQGDHQEQHSHQEHDNYHVEGRQRFTSPESVVVEGDWSNAAFFLAAGALGEPVVVNGLLPTSLQGDKAITELLRGFGANVQTTDEGVLVSAEGLHARDIDVSEVPDLFPVLAVVASVARGTTRLMNAARLRMKESDRISAVATMLGGLGADVQELPDALVVHGRPHLIGGTVSGASDHRIVMAAAVASILCENPVTILGAEVVAKSYPRFFDDFNAMGGDAHVINHR